MKRKFFFIILTLILNFSLFSQEKFTFSGTVSDAKSNEKLIGVAIQIIETDAIVYTNEYGFYSITLPKGTYTVDFFTSGFTSHTEQLVLDKNMKRNFFLREENKQIKQLDEIAVTAKNRANIRKPEISINKLTIQTIKQMPVVLGEVDIIKSLLFLPGVTNAGEGQSGFNVRGGGADQNLVLLDEATVYNSSHVFGFFSVFNPDAIKDLKLYKGGIPSRFGGRASSVLDIYQKDGNSNKFAMNGGIGLITSRVLAEGPIVKEKGSFLFGARGSYAHLFLKFTDNDNKAYFYDLNTKLNYKLNNNNNLYLSGYFGRDIFTLSESFTNTYGNSTLNLRWNHLFSDKLFSNLSLIYSDYYYGLKLDFIGFNWDSGIKAYNLKYDFKHYLSDRTKVNYGANAIYYNFNPGTVEPIDDESSINYRQLDRKYALEPSFYFDVEQSLREKISISYGLRLSLFYRLGESTINYYENNQPVVYDEELKIYEKGTPISTQYFGRNKTIENFGYFEPRFAMSYEINKDQSVKMGYNRMVQYLQLISNTASPTPLDVWTPSDNYIKPQIADQISLGYFKNFKDDNYTLELETYYKGVQNRMDYIDGADLIANEAIEQVILNGRMRSYGLEMLLRKNTGNFNGWIAYTLSKSEQQTPGRTPTEIGINYGKWYRSAYDKTHNVAVTASYKYNDRWTFGGNFTFQSGQPVTYPAGKYVFEDVVVPYYNSRNDNRLPAYHHLDVSATMKTRQKREKKLSSEWVFSIYNLYSRKNAASISFSQNSETGKNEATRLSIFGIVPAVSYNFKF
ncbi:TonB-dependent receptor [Flavobacterium amniphilum]|uniref:TonB-dependent receptor n=1 Tax=Flavobacterium amniphilum TaxID=1834035 RepID=UPI00202A4E00|nr:carboxypeptidase-like regulatory domain-containing protein [Flavobacterium amniphilum]MCL9805795.1 TonB-dependent receptor [Flavobacterium amniphilum]MCL9806382.1 TonB-dependent receptor [Flavobacterium amniphilum]